MKKAGVLLVTAFLLVGCSAQPTFETVGDENIQTVSATMQQVLLEYRPQYYQEFLQVYLVEVKECLAECEQMDFRIDFLGKRMDS